MPGAGGKVDLKGLRFGAIQNISSEDLVKGINLPRKDQKLSRDDPNQRHVIPTPSGLQT